MNWLRGVWQWIADRIHRRPAQLETRFVEEIPEPTDPRVLYVVGEGEHHWFTTMACPCGCGETLHMSLMPEGRPRWRLEQHPDGSASLHPSVWRKVGCGSHFYLRQGRVVWCESSQPMDR